MRGAFQLFDTHVHIGTAQHSGRIQCAEDILRAMDEYGIDKSLAIPFPVVEDFRASHNEIGAALKAHPGRFLGAACIYPFIPRIEFREEVRRCREKFGFCALKFQPQFQALNPLWQSSDFLFEIALENNLALIVHTGSGIPYALPSMYILPARKHPELKIVLAHCGGGGLFSGEAIVAASLCPNIYLELSSLMPNQVLEVLHHIPSNRLMIGSDLPENLTTEFSKIEGLQISNAAKADILWNTGIQLFTPRSR